MSNIESLTDNHSKEPVPDTETVGALAIATIIVGVAITLPAFLVGAEILSSLGAVKGAAALFGGGLVLVLFAALTMRVGAETRLSTYSIISRTFGDKGAVIINGILTLSLFGWFGVTAMLFGQAAAAGFDNAFGVHLSEALLASMGGILMIVTTIFGFRAIDRLSRVAVPMLLLLLAAGVWLTLAQAPADVWTVSPVSSDGAVNTVGAAVSVVIGSFMVGVTIAPDLARFMRKPSSNWLAATLSYGIGGPLVLFTAGLPALATGSNDLIGNMIAIGLGLPALIVVVFATWTTNTNNLYSASLGLARSLPRAKDWVVTLVAGVAGVSLALAGILDHFIGFLILLSVTIPPIAGIYIADHFIVRKSLSAKAQSNAISITAFAAWACGVAVGIASERLGITLTSVPACDAIIAAAVGYISFTVLAPRLAFRRRQSL